MLFSLSLAALLTATPERLTVTALRGVSVGPELLSFCTETLGNGLLREGFKVTTPGDVSTLLGVERQKQLLGCGADSMQCLVELSQALGADAVVVGTVAKLGSTFQVSAKVLESKQAAPLATAEAAAASEDQLISAINSVTQSLARQLKPPPPPPSRALTLGLPLGVAGALAVGGGVLLGISLGMYGDVTAVGAPVENIAAKAKSIVTLRDASVGLFIGAGVAALGGLLWTVLTPSASPRVALSLSPRADGAEVVFTWR